MELFPRQQVVGIFRGFREGGLEFHADLALPYRNDFQRIPMHGQFVLVQLETPEEAVLGRIASFSSEGKLSFGSGEEFNIRAVQEERPIPEDLREQYLKYRVNIRVLGVLRNSGGNTLTFVPSHRRLPHVGSAVAFLSGEVLKEVCRHNIEEAEIGHFALGEYIYAQGSGATQIQSWMRVEAPEIMVRFPVSSLVARRSFVFMARSAPSPFYGSFTAGGIELDIRQLRPSDVISIALPPERQLAGLDGRVGRAVVREPFHGMRRTHAAEALLDGLQHHVAHVAAADPGPGDGRPGDRLPVVGVHDEGGRGCPMKCVSNLMCGFGSVGRS